MTLNLRRRPAMQHSVTEEPRMTERKRRKAELDSSPMLIASLCEVMEFNCVAENRFNLWTEFLNRILGECRTFRALEPER